MDIKLGDPDLQSMTRGLGRVWLKALNPGAGSLAHKPSEQDGAKGCRAWGCGWIPFTGIVGS